MSDNVDTRKRVRDLRSDHHDTNHHMYSMLVVKARVLPPPVYTPFVRPSLVHLPVSSFFPSEEDVRFMKRNLVIMVSHVLCENMKQFKHILKSLPKYIYHEYSDEMCQKSEVLVIDVLHKNEAKHDDMKAIMQTIQKYKGAYIQWCNTLRWGPINVRKAKVFKISCHGWGQFRRSFRSHRTCYRRLAYTDVLP